MSIKGFQEGDIVVVKKSSSWGFIKGCKYKVARLGGRDGGYQCIGLSAIPGGDPLPYEAIGIVWYENDIYFEKYEDNHPVGYIYKETGARKVAKYVPY